MSSRLPDLVDFYIYSVHELGGHTQATIAAYRKHIGPFLRWLESSGHDLDIQNVTAFHVLSYMQAKKVSGASPRYIRGIYQHVKTFFSWAVEWEIIERSPMTKIKPPKVPKQSKGFIKREQFQALLDECPLNTFTGARRQAMIWLLITTGMRRMELANLKLSDLEWKVREGIIKIRQGKGQKDRWVPFLPGAAGDAALPPVS